MIKRYSQQEALEIINQNKELQKDLKKFNNFITRHEDGLDHSFDYGNFFSLYDPKTDTVDKTKVVIQWCADDDMENEDELFDFSSHEVIADSVEEAVVILRDIELAEGHILNA